MKIYASDTGMLIGLSGMILSAMWIYSFHFKEVVSYLWFAIFLLFFILNAIEWAKPK